MSYKVIRHNELPEQSDLCGTFQEILGQRDIGQFSLARFRITKAGKHYHKKTTEVYIVVSGRGYLEINDERVRLEPDMTVVIKPKSVHRAIADKRNVLDLYVISTPPWTLKDQFEVGENG